MNPPNTPQFYTQGAYGWGPGGNVPGLFGWGPGGNVPGLFGWGPGGNVPGLFGWGPGGNVPGLFGWGPGGNVPPLFGMGPGGNVPPLFGTSLNIEGYFSTGYIRDASDARDYPFEPATKSGPIKKCELTNKKAFGPVATQGPVQSCAAHAVTALAEYALSVKGAEPAPALSRLYNYKVARSILGMNGDGGATMRESMKALRRYGCPLEESWPYEGAFLDKEPLVSDIEKAKRFHHSWEYHRLDHAELDDLKLLVRMKRAIMDDLPVAFGVSLPAAALHVTAKHPFIPTFKDDEPVAGKHCLVAVEYDDEKVYDKKDPNKKGAFLIRNSWGCRWGKDGYAWLPYEYVLGSWTTDLWTLRKVIPPTPTARSRRPARGKK